MAHPLLTWCFAVVVAQRGNQFLLVRERKHQQRWYFPAGGVEPGETFEQAAVRETLEEAGIRVRLTGVVCIEHTLVAGRSARLRVVYAAEAVDDGPTKTKADQHSLEARWLTFAELSALPLRGPDVLETLEALRRGGAVYSLAVMRPESALF